MKRRFFLALAAMLLLAAGVTISCEGDDDNNGDGVPADDDTDSPACDDEGGAAPTSSAMIPNFSPEYYAEQSRIYFDTLDSSADPDSIPNYSELVARWEWPPWLKLTGFGRKNMIRIDKLLRLYPTAVPERDCRAFDVQPFGRCRVVFSYNGGEPCPIYEEFTFNEYGEVTFIEAWSDLPGFFPADAGDVWAEGPDVQRLSTRVPGLGTASGLIDVDGECMREAAAQDEDVADFVAHAKHFAVAWIINYLDYGADSFRVGCGW
ncbi:MAG: hypothetical protein M5R36_24935 [Deltaproteobacteria bacterium]|nr:hypothetical protein [Deltaproteobacteria bacterium]